MNSRTFTNQKRFVCDDEDCRMTWNGAAQGERFRCFLCGHRFRAGDGVRWISTSTKSPDYAFPIKNILVCDTCDTPDVIDRWIARVQAFYSDEFWALRAF